MSRRPPGEDLAALDDAVLPAVARRVQHAVATGRDVSREWLPSGDALRRDPVRAVRDHPHGVIAIMIVLVVALSLGALATHGSDRPAAVPGPDTVTSLGPAAGKPVSTYRDAAAGRLDAFARAHPRDATFAVVDFTGYLTPAQVQALVGSRQTVRAYVHVSVPGVRTPTHVVSLTSAAALPQAIARTGQVAAQEAKGYRQLLDVVASPSTERERTVRDVYAERVTATEAEVKALTPTCRCVYAVVVQATGVSLRQLAAQKPVRIVDPAPPGAPLGSLALIPLLPEVTARVPADQGFR